MPVIDPFAPAPPPAPTQQGPCTWPINTNCCPEWSTYSPQTQNDAAAWATEILWALTGRQYGACPVTVRPCGATCNFPGGWMTFPVESDGYNSGPGGWSMFPYINASGQWRNCVCAGGCTCRASQEVWLPGPVVAIIEVSVNGVVVPNTAYRVDNQNTLVRTDGGTWPECQNFDLSEPTDTDTFFVTYQRGFGVPVAGQIAAGILACHFAKDCASGCGLPGNLSSLTRQGVEITMVDPTEVLGAGLTGIPEVDLWIRTVNPASLAQRVRVWSPDVDRPRMVS